MCTHRRSHFAVLIVLVALLVPSAALAQSTISGLVTDATGGILPGVLVEAESPALIEKVRSASTDTQGRYTIVDIRPGVYAVTFTLQGFNVVKREGIEVAANVSVPLNVELSVGALGEMVTVSGATPVVDVQQASRQQVIDREVLDALPSARTYVTTGAIVPGVKMTKPDIGGTGVFFQAYLRARGKTHQENAFEVEGLDTRSPRDVAANTTYTNFAMAQDVVVQTSGISAETSGGGVRINMIPREGGNSVRGEVYVAGMHRSWQSNNITDDLISRGLPTPDATDKLYEINPAVGGPFVRDRLWYFFSPRLNRMRQAPAGAHFADGTTGYNYATADSGSLRLTWQATARNKFVWFYDQSWKSEDHIARNAEVSPAGHDWATAPSRYLPGTRYVTTAKWTSPITNRLLAESGVAVFFDGVNTNVAQPGVIKERGTPEWYASAARLDFIRATLNTATGSVPTDTGSASYAFSSAISYVTGSHAFKTGFQGRRGWIKAIRYNGNADLAQRYRDGRPDTVDVFVAPSHTLSSFKEIATYAQDTWTLKQLTLTPGVRFEYYTGAIEPTQMGAGRFLPEREVNGFSPVPAWFDVSPRFGAVYDLFGDARTALKFSANKYMARMGADFPGRYNPIGAANDRRNWFDCDLLPRTSTCSGAALPTNGDDIAQDNEIGPSNNNRFGLSPERRADPDIENSYSWDYSLGVQHQLMPRVAVNATLYYTRFYNLQGASNVALTPADYLPFQVASPLNGETITVFNLDRAKQGVSDIVDRTSIVNRRTYQGFEVGGEVRLAKGTRLLGGWTMERVSAVTCDTENPNGFRFCDQTGELFQELGSVPTLPFRHEYKFALVQPLPWQFEGGLSFLSYPGESLAVNWAVPAELFPGGRTAAVTVPLVPPGSKYLERWNQLDLNFKRAFRVGRYEMRPSFDIYNVLNSSVVLTELQQFGPTLGQPTSILQGRFMKLGLMFRF